MMRAGLTIWVMGFAATFTAAETPECGCPERMPAWRVEINSLFMQRAQQRRSAIFQTAAGQDLLTTADFGYDFEPGVEATLEIPFADPANSLALRYIWLHNWSDSRSLVVQGSDVLATTPPNSRGFATFDNVVSTSQFQSADIAVRRQLFDWLTSSLGFRYAQFDDRLVDNQIGIGALPGTAIGANQFLVRNHLYGLEWNCDATLLRRGRWQLDGSFRKGIYLNDVTASASAIFPPLGTDTQLADRDQNVAFLGETTLRLTYDVNSRVKLMAGYRLIGMLGIATAGGQIANTTDIENLTVPQRTTVDADRGVILHGLNLGLQVNF